MRTPIEHRASIGAMRMCWFEWPALPGHEEQAPIVLVHATGFHARCWDRVVEHLGPRRVIAIDQRGHGRSDNDPPIAWDRFGADLVEFLEQREAAGWVGVGHSMGGHCIVQAALARPGSFSRLVLVDPVMLDPQTYSTPRTWGHGAEHPTSRRRNEWTSWEEMFARFADRSPFSGWQPEVLEDYCRHGVLPRRHGEGFELACPPIVEASVYVSSTVTDLTDRLGEIQAPVLVLRAASRGAERDPMDFSASPTWPGLAACFPCGREIEVSDLTHFMPMEAPERVALWILQEPDSG